MPPCIVGSPPPPWQRSQLGKARRSESVKSLILIAASVVLEPHGSTGVAS